MALFTTFIGSIYRNIPVRMVLLSYWYCPGFNRLLKFVSKWKICVSTQGLFTANEGSDRRYYPYIIRPGIAAFLPY